MTCWDGYSAWDSVGGAGDMRHRKTAPTRSVGGSARNILRAVYIHDCVDVTLEGAARMRAALPQCVVLT